MVNEPLSDYFNKIKKKIDLVVNNLKNINIDDLRFVRLERIIWITKEGFYGYQPKKINFNKPFEYVQGVDMFVFIDQKWTYVVFDGEWGYRFIHRGMDLIKIDFLKSWGEPRTLSLAQKVFDAQELDFSKAREKLKEDTERRQEMKPYEEDPAESTNYGIEDKDEEVEEEVSEAEDEDETDTIYKPEENGLEGNAFGIPS